MSKEIVQVVSPYIIKNLLDIDDLYGTLSYDGSPSLEEFIPTGLWYFLLEDGYTAGFINLVPLNNVLWQPHIFVFKKYRGNGSEEWGKLVMAKHPYFKFMALTPYIEAKKYAEKLGFSQLATLPASIQKNGKLLDQYILEK